MATPLGNAVPLSGNGFIDALAQGSKWSSTNLTYSLWDVPGLDSWSETGKILFAAALDIISIYTPLTFTNVAAPSSSSDIEGILTGNALQYEVGFGTLGLGVFPDPKFGDYFLQGLEISRADFPNIEGTIFYDSQQSPFVNYAYPGGYGFLTILHEIGHALGLKHPHDDGGNSRPTFAQIGQPFFDSQLYTMMSYHPASGASAGWGNPITPMILDVQTLQYIYGANMAYHAGNDVYTLTDDGMVETLWDAGGYDTFDASALNVPVTLYLIPGWYSSIGSTYGTIAFNVTIENARGSSVSDALYGNESDNALYGHGGNDLLAGSGGNDAVYGGMGIVDTTDGSDILYGDLGGDSLYGNAGDDTIYGGRGIADGEDAADLAYGGKGTDSIYGNAGNDSLFGGGSSVDPLDTWDVIFGGYGADYILGNGGDDLLYGGGSVADPSDLGDTINGGVGNDSIFGNGGNDELSGAEGNDWLHGGVGDDRHVIGNENGLDFVLHFEGAGQAGGDLISVLANVNNTGISTIDQLVSRLTNEDGRAWLDLGNGNTVFIENITTALVASDFEILG